MSVIQIHKRGDGWAIPDGDNYLIRSPAKVQADSNGFPTEVRSFRTWAELRNALREMVASDPDLVVRASLEFEPLAKELGFTWMVAENWSGR